LIRLTIPTIEEDDLEAVREALASGYLVQGPRVAAFEHAVADYVGTQHAVAVSNCTSALLLSLMALEIGAGDRVAVTTYSWPATANVIALCGAEPVFVEIDASTFNMDPGALAETLKRIQVKAILPVHTFGGMADMPGILEAADRHGVPVVEDAACALGAELNDRRAGTWGVMGCFSFHPRKAITTGEGGMVTTDDPTLARKLRILRNHGQDPDASTPDFVTPGHNMRLTEFQAALGLTQMEKIERIITSRRAQAGRYNELLSDGVLATPQALRGSRHVYQSYVALLPSDVAPERAEVISHLKRRGIETTIGTYHLPLVTYFRQRGDFKIGDFPVTDVVAARAISLPMFEGLTPAQQETITRELRDSLNARDRALRTEIVENIAG
jgi:dTDP-4-amino-4,6-dideoxygalactose transaminase